MLVLAFTAAFAGETLVWVGRQETVGTRKVPLLGTVKSYTHVYTIAKVEDRGSEIVMVETPCRIDIQGGGGVKLDYAVAHVASVPPPTIRFTGTDDAMVAA